MKARTRLKVLRVMRDLTQGQLARKAGLNITRYWQIENGEGADPRPDEKDAIADALNVLTRAIDWPVQQGVKAS